MGLFELIEAVVAAPVIVAVATIEGAVEDGPVGAVAGAAYGTAGAIAIVAGSILD